MHALPATLSAFPSTLKAVATLAVVLTLALLSGCDPVGPPQSNEGPSQEDPSGGELRARVQEALGSKVTEFHLRTIEVSEVADELEAGQATVPLATPDSGVVEVTLQGRPANLRPDSVDTGLLREGPETAERVPLPPEQSYLLGEAGTGRFGGLTILDDDRTMLRGLVGHPDHGLSYVQSVNHLLRTDEHPNRHVIYNAENAESLEIDDGPYPAAEESGARQPGGAQPNGARPKGAKSNGYGSTSVVLDGDAQFYRQNRSTVWRRQESLFLAVKVTLGRREPNTSGTWGLDLRIAGQEVWVSGGPSSKDPDKLMRRLTDPGYYLINPLSEKQLHLFLVGYSMNGNDGQAAGIGDPQGGWGGGKGKNHLFSEANGPVLHFDRVLLTHEVGHLIGGHHKYAVKAGCSPFPVCGRSIMNHNTPPNQFFFSDKNDRQIREVINATLP